MEKYSGTSFINNNYLLIYNYGGNKNEYLTFRFDNIVDVQVELGIGLYTEGTGNLKNVKAATNPVKFVFRKTLEVEEEGRGVNQPKYSYYEGKRRFNLDSEGFDNVTQYKSYDAKIETGKVSFSETSIFNWAEKINNGGEIDRAQVRVYASVKEKLSDGKKSNLGNFVNFLDLKDALPLSAVIKRNPYQEINVAELTFVADELLAHRQARFNEGRFKDDL